MTSSSHDNLEARLRDLFDRQANSIPVSTRGASDVPVTNVTDVARQQTGNLSILATAGEPEHGACSRTRSSRRLVAVAAGVVVVLIASVAVAVTRSGSHGGNGANGGRSLTIEALATTTQTQSARISITQTLPSGPSQPHPEVLVTTGLVDYRAGNGRFETTTQSSSGAVESFQTELVVAGHRYLSIGPWLQGVPESVIGTKKWIDVDTESASLQSAGLNPFDPFGLFKSLHISLEDRGTAKFGGQTVEHYTATKRISHPSSSGPVGQVTLAFDVYVDSHGRVTHVQLGEKGAGADSTAQIDFSDYGVHVDVAAPRANLVVRASALPSESPATLTSGRRGALVLRQDIDTSAAECKTPGTLTHTEPLGNHGPPLCTLLGATIVTGDDVTSAVARPAPRSGGHWCVAPTITPDALAQLRSYTQANAPIPDLFVISHGKYLGTIALPSRVHNGDCWIVTDRMTETTARSLAAQLSGR